MELLLPEVQLENSLLSVMLTWSSSNVPKTACNAVTINSPKHQNVPNARISLIETVTVLTARMDSSKLPLTMLKGASSVTQHADNVLGHKSQTVWRVSMDSIWEILFTITIALIVFIWLRTEQTQRAFLNAIPRQNVWQKIQFQR